MLYNGKLELFWLADLQSSKIAVGQAH